MTKLNSKIPVGPIEKQWDSHRFNLKLVNAANKRKYTIVIVGTGLAGSSAAASLAELGYNVLLVSYHESPRRAHSIAAQGGINAPKNYSNDGDSIYRLFYDTVKGGDYRARESNVYRLAQVSGNIIDQCVAQGVPFLASTEACWTIGPSGEHRCPERFTHADKRDSNCSLVPIPHSAGRWMRER